jgi:hypothetical protein
MASRLLSALGQAVLYVAAHAFRVVAIATDEDSSTFATWPTITAGSGAPSEAQPDGSIYLRTSNGALYNRVGGAWVASAGGDGELTAIAALVSAADRVPYFTGAGTAALATFNALGRSLVGAASVAAARAALSLDTGDSPTFVQVTAALVGNASTATKLASASYYAGVEQTGTGAEQIFAHALGTTPSIVWVSLSEAPNPTLGFDVAYGVHSATEIKVTVTSGIKFFVFALK